MFVRIIWKSENEENKEMLIQCDEVVIQKIASKKKEGKSIYLTTRKGMTRLHYELSGEDELYFMNDEGRTIDSIR